ncbi:cytidine/deoxycytidylate deaminase family protein [Actinomadura rudentiformis]|uniref:Cytidine deaminase n=1 Tax=Actinomadura rudentiformis TaxID=359158 RepID=A0A6H9YVH1_9ACTN|nr:cytidine deaminase [Actinomadura rudentiformis]KAB2345593.1 cytidine deaminase [Actinomadura rudentiformis]
MNDEDKKIITLARAARARTGAAEGAAVRDETGRTYSATSVDLPALKLTALQVAIAMAVSSGAEELEAAALVTADESARDSDVAAVRDLGPKAPVFVAAPDGSLKTTLA